jgi:putative GTP pyrophosphokinase
VTTEDAYSRRYPVLRVLAKRLEAYIANLLDDSDRVDYVRGRAKEVDRFMVKAAKVDKDGAPRYAQPLAQIQDQVGVRVVTYFLSDVEDISQAIVKKYLREVEERAHIPDAESEFGYVARHFILVVPTDVTPTLDKSDIPDFFELQIQTLFQHAWSEAEHDLGYKQSVALNSNQKRRLAFTAAQAWGADQMFEELYQETAGR